MSALEINHSKHLDEIDLPEGVKVLGRANATLVTIVPPSGMADEKQAAAEAAAAGAASEASAAAAAGAAAPGAAAGAKAPAAGAKAPAAGAKAPEKK